LNIFKKSSFFLVYTQPIFHQWKNIHYFFLLYVYVQVDIPEDNVSKQCAVQSLESEISSQ